MPSLNCALERAIRSNQDSEVQKLLEMGANPDNKDNPNFIALHYAARSNDLAIVDILLKNNADLNIRDSTNFTALHRAAQYNLTKIAEILLQNNACADAIEVNGFTPLYWATKNQNIDSYKLIFKYSNKKNLGGVLRALCGVLRALCGKNHINEIIELLNLEVEINDRDSIGRITIHVAAEQGYFKVVNLLLAAGANPNIQDDFKFTPLHLAASHGHTNIVKLLLANGAKNKYLTKYNQTPLSLAEKKNHVEIVTEIDNYISASKQPCCLQKLARHTIRETILINKSACSSIKKEVYELPLPRCVQNYIYNTLSI